MLILTNLIIGLFISFTAFSETAPSKQNLQLILDSSKSEFALNEPIYLTLHIKNIGSQPISIIRPEPYRHYELFREHLTGYISSPEGDKIIEPSIYSLAERRFPGPMKDDFIQLRPNQEIIIKICFGWDPDKDYWQFGSENNLTGNDALETCFSTIGEYSIRFELALDFNEYVNVLGYEKEESNGKGFSIRTLKTETIEVPDAWTGKTSSNKLKIKIKKNNEE